MPQENIWRERGFQDFIDGEFGNGGQNLYVSRAGVLQRIFRFDLDNDGYVDLLFVNSQDMNERPPIYVHPCPPSPDSRIELPTLGAYAGAVGDLNGDGIDELIVANQNNGTHSDVAAFVYYGSLEGYSEKYKLELPAPNCRAVAVGDFNGDGRVDLAFASAGKLRIFYQHPEGFRPGSFADLELEVTHMAAGDLDGDGSAELYVRVRKDRPMIFWGGHDGINLERKTWVGGPDETAGELPASTPGWMAFAEGWRPKIVEVDGTLYLFRAEGKQACLYPVHKDRTVDEPHRFEVDYAVSAAAGDLNGDGRDELVLAVCRDRSEITNSWIYWNDEKGFTTDHRTAVPTTSARDVAVGDLNGDGRAEVVICQGRTDVLNTTESLVFSGILPENVPDPLRLETHDATTVLLAQTAPNQSPQLVFINHVGGRVRGDVGVCIYHGGPNGYDPARKTELPGWSAPDAQCCDFNDNGWPDVYIGNCAENAPHLDPGSFLYWGGPDGFSPDRKLVFPTIRAHGSAVGDFRHSGYLDLAVGGFYNAELLIFRGGPGGFDLENPQRIIMDPCLVNYRPTKDAQGYRGADSDYCEPRWLLAADFNNDGWLDLFVSQIAGPRSLILWGGSHGYSMDRCQWLNVEGAACAQAADLTGNGYPDLIVAGHQALSKKWRYDSYIYIYYGGPEGFREDRRCQLPAHTCNSLTIADFNRDGVLDIFATSYNGGRDRDLDSYIYWGRPGGVYSMEHRSRLFSHSACGCLAADFNEDGWIDLAVACHKTCGNHVGYSQVWWNGPKGFYEQRVTELPTLGPHGMLPVDPGNLLDRGPEEYYTSSPFELPAGAAVTRIGWDAEVPKKTWVKAQLRFAPKRELLVGAPWQGPGGGEEWFTQPQSTGPLRQVGGWVQYRLALGAVNGGNTPRVTEVWVGYSL